MKEPIVLFVTKETEPLLKQGHKYVAYARYSDNHVQPLYLAGENPDDLISRVKASENISAVRFFESRRAMLDRTESKGDDMKTEKQFTAERKVNPQYPFSPALEFCETHNADSPVPEVIGCKKCKAPKPAELTPEAKALFRSKNDAVVALNGVAEAAANRETEPEEEEFLAPLWDSLGLKDDAEEEKAK